MAEHGPAPKAEFPYDELRRVNFERKKDPLLLNLACITPSESQQVTLTATLTVARPSLIPSLTLVNHREYELLDTGIFDDNRYFDVEIELRPWRERGVNARRTWTENGHISNHFCRYAQANPDDTLAASLATVLRVYLGNGLKMDDLH